MCGNAKFGWILFSMLKSNNTCRTTIQKLSRHDQVCLLRLHFERYFSPSSAWVCTTVLERWTLCFGSDKNRKLKVKLWWVGARKRKMRAIFVPFILSEGIFLTFVFIPMYNVLNTLSKYTYFYISKNITSCTFLFVLKNIESLHCILNLIQTKLWNIFLLRVALTF